MKTEKLKIKGVLMRKITAQLFEAIFFYNKPKIVYRMAEL